MAYEPDGYGRVESFRGSVARSVVTTGLHDRITHVGDATCADQVDTRPTTLSYEQGKGGGTGKFPWFAGCLAETAFASRQTKIIRCGPINYGLLNAFRALRLVGWRNDRER
jgi:hypothetical protein